MTHPFLFSVTHHVAKFSINAAPWNLMSLEYIDQLEQQLPAVLADEDIRAMVFTAEGLDHFSAGMNLKQIPEGTRRVPARRTARARGGRRQRPAAAGKRQ